MKKKNVYDKCKLKLKKFTLSNINKCSSKCYIYFFYVSHAKKKRNFFIFFFNSKIIFSDEIRAKKRYTKIKVKFLLNHAKKM